MQPYSFYHYEYGLFEDIDLIDFKKERIKYDSDWYSFSSRDKQGVLLQLFPEFNAVNIEGDKCCLMEGDRVCCMDELSDTIIKIKPYKHMSSMDILHLRLADTLVVVSNSVVRKVG